MLRSRDVAQLVEWFPACTKSSVQSSAPHKLDIMVTLVMLALGRLEQEEERFIVILGYIASSSMP